MAISTNGITDYLYRGILTLAPFTYNNFVVSMWVKPVETEGGGTDTVLSLTQSGAADYFRVNFYHGQLDPPINYSWSAVFYDGTDTLTLSYTPSHVDWTHIAVRVASNPADSTEQVYRALYVDGVLRDEDATVWSDTFNRTLSRLHIACRPSGITRAGYFPGTICELGWWVYTTDITDHDWVTRMARYSPLACRPYSLDYYWPLQSAECYGLQDLLNNHCDFTNFGGAWTQDHPAVVWPYGIGG